METERSYHVNGAREPVDSIFDDVDDARVGTAASGNFVSTDARTPDRQPRVRETHAEKMTSPFPITSSAAYRSSMMSYHINQQLP